MKQVIRPALGASALLLIAASAAPAAPIKYAVDRNHSDVGFSVRHIFTKVQGRFSDFQGTIVFDDKDASKIAVDASAVASSITTQNERRDGHLKSPDFFDAEKYPALSFKSTKVTANGQNKYKIAGDLTMRGVTKPVVFDAEFFGAGPAGKGNKAGFAATAVVNRKDFGINWNQALDNGGMVLSDDVTINLNIEANQVVEEATNVQK
ncbi:MAG: YceI family protein [Candidatus Eisenbacteria bacterium]|nr:YceI family protein [Candidatus Eisenbacteria bacterium]